MDTRTFRPCRCFSASESGHPLGLGLVRESAFIHAVFLTRLWRSGFRGSRRSAAPCCDKMRLLRAGAAG